MKINYPKVSIIIPTYNRANLLSRAIKSVLNQTFHNFELIIINDGSTDNTEKVIKQFQKNDRRIKYIKLNENSGIPAHPKNVGIKNSRGAYIAFLDDDDEWLSGKLDKQLKIFYGSKKYKLGFVGCNTLVIDKNKVQEHRIQRFKNIFQKLLERNFIFSCSEVIVKNSIINNIGLFDESIKMADDQDMWIRIAQKYDFDFVPEPLFKYYRHESNITKTRGYFDKAKDQEYILKKHKNFYKKYPKAYSVRLINIGTNYLLSGDLKIARKYFFRAIKITPWYWRSYLNLIISLFGKRFYERILYQKKKIAGYFLNQVNK